MTDIKKFHSGIVVSDSKLDTIKRYLPSNYHATQLGGKIVVFGKDNAGWTWDDYVAPRLASGGHYVRKDA